MTLQQKGIAKPIPLHVTNFPDHYYARFEIG
ncbi:hypothetical protein ABIB50_000856 [Mucilaginibacter sp. UYCu711]